MAPGSEASEPGWLWCQRLSPRSLWRLWSVASWDVLSRRVAGWLGSALVRSSELYLMSPRTMGVAAGQEGSTAALLLLLLLLLEREVLVACFSPAVLLLWSWRTASECFSLGYYTAAPQREQHHNNSSNVPSSLMMVFSSSQTILSSPPTVVKTAASSSGDVAAAAPRQGSG